MVTETIIIGTLGNCNQQVAVAVIPRATNKHVFVVRPEAALGCEFLSFGRRRLGVSGSKYLVRGGKKEIMSLVGISKFHRALGHDSSDPP